MFIWTILHSCLDIVFPVTWSPVASGLLSPRTGCMSSCVSVFGLCRLLIVVRRSDNFFFSYPCHLIHHCLPSTSVFWHLTHCFHPISSFSGHYLRHDTRVSDSSTVSKKTVPATKLQVHTRGYLRPVLWHLCLCEQNCSLQTNPHVYTHNMRVANKVHSLHPITESTPSHFLCSALICFW